MTGLIMGDEEISDNESIVGTDPSHGSNFITRDHTGFDGTEDYTLDMEDGGGRCDEFSSTDYCYLYFYSEKLTFDTTGNWQITYQIRYDGYMQNENDNGYLYFWGRLYIWEGAYVSGSQETEKISEVSGQGDYDGLWQESTGNVYLYDSYEYEARFQILIKADGDNWWDEERSDFYYGGYELDDFEIEFDYIS
jgi:hypothetical protein